MELDAQPDHKMACTARLDVARMNRTPRFMLISGSGMGIGIHIERASVRARVGARVNRSTEEVEGYRGSLMNSFRASAMGCRMP